MNPPTREYWTCPGCELVQEEASPGTRCSGCSMVLVPAKVLEAHVGDEALGKIVSDKYAVIGVLGTGGFGTVYHAIQEPVGRPVAVKIVHKQHAKDPALRARFFREARVVAQLSDPVVVTLYDYGDDPDVGLYTVFEFVDGMTLSKRLAEGPQDPVWVTYVLLQLLKGLAEAHAMDMVHRDIKPANIMIVKRPDGDEVVRLLDFGIAKVLTQEHREATVETQQGVVVGTPEFMSPEQARANRELDARSDIYSLGVVAYSLLAGKNPFKRGSVIDTIMAQCSAEAPPFDPELQVPPLLEEAVRKAIAKEPSDRHQDAPAMSVALRSVFPPSTVPAGLTPSPSYTSLLASAEQRAPRSRSSLASASISQPEAALDMGAGHTMAEPVSESLPPSKSKSGVWLVLLLLVLTAGGGLVYLRGADHEVEGLPVEASSPSPAVPSKATPPAQAAPVETPKPPPAEVEARSGPEAQPEPRAEPKQVERRKGRKSPRSRVRQAVSAPEPKKATPKKVEPKKAAQPDSLEVPEF
ncbi:MAG: protein kinase [Myxococcota bacterium]